MKVVNAAPSVEGTEKLGWPITVVQPLGIILLACTIRYVIPRTAILSAIHLTGYLGGATATMVRVGEPFLFSVIFGVFVWCGLYLRDTQLGSLIPLRKQEGIE